MWETYDNVADNNLRVLEDYHHKITAGERDERFK